MVWAFSRLLEKISVKDQLNLAMSQWDLRLSTAWNDENEMRESRNRAIEHMRSARNDIDDKLKRMASARPMVAAALTLFMICVAAEFFTFIVCGAFGF